MLDDVFDLASGMMTLRMIWSRLKETLSGGRTVEGLSTYRMMQIIFDRNNDTLLSTYYIGPFFGK